MKKILMIVSSSILLTSAVCAQEQNDFDRKVRFGLRVNGSPGWFSSNDNFTSKAKTNFGYGFGLNMEFRLSNIVHFQTGVGGDFERGTVKYNNSPLTASPGTWVGYVIDTKGELVSANDGEAATSYYGTNNSQPNKGYILNERKIKATYVTVPLILKMMTKEFSGLKYFGAFGGELGFRTALKADDKTIASYSPNISTITEFENKNLNIARDGSIVPVRLGLNAGIGAEYRLSGSTAFVFSVNYFRSFTNVMRAESRFNHTKATRDTNGKLTFDNLNQGLFYNAIRINLGIMF
jgi:hypothetical protein